MNPEEGMKLLRDPNQWELELLPRTGAFPERSRASFWTMTATAAVAATAIIAVAALGISSLQSRPPVAAPGPTSSATPESTRRPAPQSDYAGTATCESLLDISTVADYTTRNLELGGPLELDSADRSIFQPMSKFLAADGLVCLWAEGNSEIQSSYGYGPMAGENEEIERADLIAKGATVTESGDYSMYAVAQTGEPSFTVFFGNGYWAYAFDTDVIGDIMRNAPHIPAYNGPATCNNLLDAETIAALDDAGLEDDSAEYTNKVFTARDTQLIDFLDYGGMLCAWGPVGAQYISLAYAFGPISDEQAAGERQSAVDDGATLSHDGEFDIYTYPGFEDMGNVQPGSLVFGDGVWAMSMDQSSGIPVIDDIIRNAPR